MKNGLVTMWSKKCFWVNKAVINHCKSQFALKKGDAVYLMRLGGYCILQAPSAKSDFQFREVLFLIG